MQAALRKFAVDDTSVSAYIYHRYGVIPIRNILLSILQNNSLMIIGYILYNSSFLET